MKTKIILGALAWLTIIATLAILLPLTNMGL